MAVLEELGSRLTDIAGIKVSFPVKNDKDFILKIYSRLCLMYDETWDFGDASFSLSCKKVLRLLNRVGIAHLTPTSADVVDPRRLPRVWSAFLAHLEQKYGSQGLYPRLRKVLKQQQILAARREAERERQQRMAGSAHSPSKAADVSTCSSAHSQDSQEDVRFAKPRPPVQKARHASASSSGSAVSPSKGGVRSRIPLPTTTRPNLIPCGKQLARTPCLSRKVQPAPSAGPTHPAQVTGSPRVVAAKAPAAPQSSPSPRDRSDSSVTDGASSTDVSPGRRRSLIPAPKTPEQTLGEYIESRLNAGFPRQAEAESTVAAVSPEPSAAPVPAAAETTLNTTYSAERPLPASRVSEQASSPAAAETTLNTTYSAERPLPASRVSEQACSPAADAREAILQAADEPAEVDDKENVRPAEEVPVIVWKPTGKVERSEAPASGGRRDTFEVTLTPADSEQTGGEDVSSAVFVEQPANDVTHSSPAEEEQSENTEATDIASAAESSTVTETTSAVTEDRTDPRPAPPQSIQKTSAPTEEPVKKRRGRTNKAAAEPQGNGGADQQETQTNAAKKRGARSKKDKAVSQGPLPSEVAAPFSENVLVPVTENPAETTQEPTQDMPKTEPPKKRGGRAKKVKQAPCEESSSGGVAEAAHAPVEDTVALPDADAPEEGGDQMKTETAITEVQPVETAHTEDQMPKKRRGRAKKEAKDTGEATGSVPHPTANAVQPDTTESLSAEVSSGTTEVAVKEAPKKRRGRANKNEKLTTELVKDESPKPDADPVAEGTPCVANQSANQADASNLEPAKAAEQKASKKPRGRAKGGRSAAPAGDAAPAPMEPAEEHTQPVSEPSEQTGRPERASLRKTAARHQQSTDSEPAEEADPTWTPGAAETAGRRGGRAATRQSRPAEVPEEAAVPGPAARGRGRRTRHAEPPAEEGPQSGQTAEPSGGGARRATRASMAHTDQSDAAPAAARQTRTPEPRRRRLRVVQESDSEGGTPPAPADGPPSPAPAPRTRRPPRKAAQPSQPRRALRALENCD